MFYIAQNPPLGGFCLLLKNAIVFPLRAYSRAVERFHGMEQVRVRLPVGPPNETCSELRKRSDFAEAKIALSIFSKPFPPTAEAVNSQSSPQFFLCCPKSLKLSSNFAF